MLRSLKNTLVLAIILVLAFILCPHPAFAFVPFEAQFGDITLDTPLTNLLLNSPNAKAEKFKSCIIDDARD